MRCLRIRQLSTGFESRRLIASVPPTPSSVSQSSSAHSTGDASGPSSHASSSSEKTRPSARLQWVQTNETAMRFGRAVLGGDFQTAHRVVEQSWKDEYVIPVVCLLALILTYYSTSSSRRSAQRRCESAEARCKEELQLLRDQMTTLLERWERDIVHRDAEIDKIQKENMDLTTTVDQMTFALKRCAPNAKWPSEW